MDRVLVSQGIRISWGLRVLGFQGVMVLWYLGVSYVSGSKGLRVSGSNSVNGRSEQECIGFWGLRVSWSLRVLGSQGVTV